MLQLSHRGLGTGHPENSLAAFRTAIASDLDGIELDVRSCSSGEVYVLHDATLDRTTNLSGKLQNYSAPKLAACRLADDSVLPTLETIIQLAGKKLIDIELKDIESAKAVAQLIDAHPQVRFIVSSKQTAALRCFRKFDKHTSVGYVCTWRLWPPKRLVKEIGATYIIWNSRLINWWGVRRAKKLELAVFAYSVRTPLIATILDHHRIEGLIVDTPAAITFDPAP